MAENDADKGERGCWEFNGRTYGTRDEMRRARRVEYVRLLDEGMNFTQAARRVGVSKRTGKAWRNGRTRATGPGRGTPGGLVP